VIYFKIIMFAGFLRGLFEFLVLRFEGAQKSYFFKK